MEWLDLRSAAHGSIPPHLHQRLSSVTSTKTNRDSKERALQEPDTVVTVDISACATSWEIKLDQARTRRAQLLQGRRNKAIRMRPGATSSKASKPPPQAHFAPTQRTTPPTRDAAATILQRWWRAQRRAGNTTPALMAAYATCALPRGGATTTAHRRAPSDRQLCDEFDVLAARIANPGTLRAAQALLLRLEHRLPGPHSPRAAAHLGRLGSLPSQRYAPRVLLAAYMMMAHPAVVLGGVSNAADAVANAAVEMLRALDDVVDHQGCLGVRMLVAFDRAWTAYVERFVAWKMQDAAVLEGDLVRMAVEMELSLVRKVGPRGRESPRIACNPDLQAICEQVERDQLLMRERLVRVGGQQAGGRMDGALLAVRQALVDDAEE